ncbi:Chaperonin Cpn60 [Artemisia annua]|uniref:Chaperonin Cpn60 n=1 Tax=Artemisia annua TaxID=35608 RepID=A0A2U1NGN1_ARTAN|nr:Chaperonin Cpn60 [Artemisia annua]
MALIRVLPRGRSVLEDAIKGGYPILVIAEDVEQEVLATFVVNKLRGKLHNGNALLVDELGHKRCYGPVKEEFKTWRSSIDVAKDDRQTGIAILNILECSGALIAQTLDSARQTVIVASGTHLYRKVIMVSFDYQTRYNTRVGDCVKRGSTGKIHHSSSMLRAGNCTRS